MTYLVVGIRKEFKDSGINFIKAESITAAGKFKLDYFAFIDGETHRTLGRSQFEENDILFSIAGVLGRVAIVSQNILPANTNQAIAIVRLSKRSKLDVEYLKYYLNSENVNNQVKRINVQAAQANFSLGDVGRLEIMCPPLLLQQKIARILSTCDAVLEKTEAAIAKYQAIKQGMMQDLFNPSKVDYWRTVALEDLADIIDPHPSHRAPEEYAQGIPFVGIGDISEFGEIKKGARKVPDKIFDEHRKRYKLDHNTIGFGRVATIGKIVRFRNYDEKVTISPTMAIMIPKNISSDYLAHSLSSFPVQEQIDKLLTGSTRSSLGIELLRKLLIPIPINNREKQKVEDSLNNIDNTIKSEQSTLSKYKKIKSGLMQDLLSGKVEVVV
ncbi:restriction endonuclease subunit S [Saccharicrinis sp. 156]|uniref:restriction endonuclease subunit S n=1 Tax=Saccharicrinis sp. 156 TaxID=3417574 RepID=UPI003D33E9A5